MQVMMYRIEMQGKKREEMLTMIGQQAENNRREKRIEMEATNYGDLHECCAAACNVGNLLLYLGVAYLETTNEICVIHLI